MIGRNDPCPCGSGKKYKKCCQSKKAVSVETVQKEELERVLQSFYEEYPERKDIPDYLKLANEWKSSLEKYLPEEMIEAICLDEFFFHYRSDIWLGYLDKQKKKIVRPSVLRVVDAWQQPRAFIGK
ncbi:SEC-C metal-binding domain-containing protein [Sporosarcina thermotolerans]|uniref:SEC-C metal-binding domain-containing protein n=1 Tax=Sporosarcina thermotolerans TaxID=633404 RepID=UPI0024BD59BE|nr:SEC-C metal-binding domain-containing protein [Sporosarcina thermotolerans]WHT49335.1 SEC-C metal-binding domain-containing protein [Sporosarcina thermotolerans]